MDVDLFEGQTLRATMPPKDEPREDRAKRSDAGFVSGVVLAPEKGLEPLTRRLTAACSTN